MMALDEHYSNRRLADIYDASNGWSVDRDFYLDMSGFDSLRILDLGCGTGLICNAYASRGHRVTGVDPAESMLEVARRQPQANKIEWVLGDSQTYASSNVYDLIIMTGHAFQVLLSEKDVLLTFKTMRKHLEFGGRIIFETRNPHIDWSSRWNKSVTVSLLDEKVFIERRVKGWRASNIFFETSYKFADQTLISRSELRFWSYEEVDQMLQANGLKIIEFYGDWNRQPYNATSSEEMIFIVQIANS